MTEDTTPATASNGAGGSSGPAAPPDIPAPVEIWRLDSAEADALAGDTARFEDLQTVLQCCERLLGDLPPAQRQEPGAAAMVDALWSLALTAYARGFDAQGAGAPLTEADVSATHPDHPEAATWHQALLALHTLGAEGLAARAPFAVGVVRAGDGTAAGLAITADPRALPDEVTVRSAGTIAYALSGLVDKRLGERQAALVEDLRARPAADLDRLERIQVAHPG